MARKLAQLGESCSSESDNENRDAVETNPLVARRNYLQLGAVAVGVFGTTRLTQSVSLASAGEDYEETFDRVVDAVEDLGMDPTGDTPIDGPLSDAYQEGTLITFPPGDYTVADNLVIAGSVSRFGISGTGESHKDVQFHFPNAEEGYWFVHQDGGRDVLLENFTIVSDDKWVCVRLRTDGGSVIQDVEWSGFIPERTDNPAQLLDPGCTTTDGVNLVRRVIMGRDGTFVAGHSYSTGTASMTGIRFYSNHVGETILDDVRIHQMGSNGVRHTQGDGVVTVEGGLYKNCHLAGLRIHNGNHPSKNSTVTGTSIIIDHENALPTGDGGFDRHGVNGIMLDSTGHGRAQPVFEECTIECRSIVSDGGWGLIRATNSGQSNPGGATFRNCQILNKTELQTIRIDTRESGVDEPRNMAFEDVYVEVSAESQPQEALFLLDGDWDGSTISNSTFYAPNGDVDGIRVRDCEDVLITDSTIFVSGRATVFENADVTTTNISHEDPSEIDEVELEHQLRIIADEDADAFEYTFTVDGKLDFETSGDYPANPERSDEIIDNGDGTMTVEGVVAGYGGDDTSWGGDTYRFEGDIIAFQKDGLATVYLDGDETDPVDLVDNGDDDYDGDGTTDQLRIIADEDAEAFEYMFTVNGTVSLVLDGDYPAKEDEETVIDNEDGTATVEGMVAGYDGDDKQWGGDTFAIDGELLTFTKEGPATVLLNGEVIDVDEYSAGPERVLSIGTKLYAEEVNYGFTIDGSVEQLRSGSLLDDGGDGPSTETVTKQEDDTYAVEGTLEGGERATYGIDGILKSMSLSGPGSITLDDEVIDPDTYGLPEQLTIVGLGEVASYNLTIDGELMADPNGPSGVEEDISGSSAEGAVTNGIASFRYDGEIVDFQFDGPAGVYHNGRQVDPERLDTDEYPYLDNWLVVHGDGSETEYVLEVVESVFKAPDLGPVETDDEVDDNLVIGTVRMETDGYRFDGELESLVVDGSAEIQLNR